MDEKALHLLGWNQLLGHWAGFAHTECGSNKIFARLPFAEKESASDHSEMVAEVRGLLQEEETLPFGGVSDVKTLVTGCKKHLVLEKDELLIVGKTMIGVSKLRSFVLRKKESLLRLASFFDLTECFKEGGVAIEALFNDDGDFRDHASGGLLRARQRYRSLKRSIENTTQDLIQKKNKLDVLQENFWTLREDRLVLPIKVTDKNLVAGIVHGRSKSGNTVFIEPSEIVDLNNQLKAAESDCAAEERLILQEESGFIGKRCDELLMLLEAVYEADTIDAAARLCEKLEGNPVSYGAKHDAVHLLEAKHPLMELSGKPCVANDFVFGDNRLLLISGPNAGGKTVCLKTLGINVLMAQAGLHPMIGEKSALPWFSKVYVVIGDEQNIENELSTFSAHLLQLKKILDESDSSSLVLIDEICGATSPHQGSSMAQAVLEHINDKNGTAFVTTHYESLKTFAAESASSQNCSVGFDLKTLAPTYRLLIGTPGSSAALELAQRTGIPVQVVDRTKHLIGDESNNVEKLLADLASIRGLLSKQKNELDEEKQKTLELQSELNRRLDKVREKIEKEHKRKHGDALKALVDTRIEIDQLKKSLPKADRQSLKETEKRLNAAAKNVRIHEPSVASEGERLMFKDLSPGDQVFLAKMNNWATVVSLESENNLQVSIGMMNAKAKFSDVKKIKKKSTSKNKQPKWKTQPSSFLDDQPQNLDVPFRTSVSTLDIRGFRVDDGESALDRFIDESLFAGRDVCFVIHGHGTGALRKGIRAYAKGHPSVKSQRPAEPQDGGDGVTILWLNF